MSQLLVLVILLGVALAVFFGAAPAHDPGPWRFDGRLYPDGRCRWVSLGSGSRCVHRAQHRTWIARHDAPLGADETVPFGTLADGVALPT